VFLIGVCMYFFEDVMVIVDVFLVMCFFRDLCYCCCFEMILCYEDYEELLLIFGVEG